MYRALCTANKIYLCTVSQKIYQILWNPKVHDIVYNRLTLAPVLIQISPVHTLSLCFCRSHFHIIHPSMPRSSKWSLSFRFPCQNPVCISHLHSMFHIIHLLHPPYLITWIIVSEEHYYYCRQCCSTPSSPTCTCKAMTQSDALSNLWYFPC